MLCPIHKESEEIYKKTVNRYIERLIPEKIDGYIRCTDHPSTIANYYC